ncbi:MAG TPA: alpha-amylase family glycosyl hydrolase [Intrasporangium sp.]|uniref:alpha-amylase family glycosyl hydrolase n=1 Tax=Intrasporangium sp. TaxID=1925024 RepID=UPI002D7903E6|nr:alpha-amylase family glycosyl hydrolase [Intrasporangium sp.]HET7399003.1 alpha-amylase family glycosyl hydrolase [Intrasporangium sp.]
MDANPYLPRPDVELTHPEWSKHATIYQINQRHFTPEGTFRAAEAHLPRLRDLGVDILWLMPVNPIGEQNRKGVLGSQYAVKDYFAVNPEFGDLEDLRHFVAAAHEHGLHVILDWVANHTAWDNVLVTEHPEWYARDWKGDFRPTPWWDWDDIIDLDYSHPELREYMTEAMKYWVREADVDGYRCDVAGFVPVDFWENARRELDAIKPVFLLAEWEARDLHTRAFDMTYAWSWNETMHRIAQGEADVEALKVYYAWNDRSWQRDAFRMMFVSNHDKNAWEGTEYEQFGDALDAAIVLSVVGEGLPLIYNGQEAGLDRRLVFFDKDEIEWREHEQGELYRRLFALKKAHRALWNGAWGGRMVRVPNSDEKAVLSFVREQEGDKVFAAFNFSPQGQTVRLTDGPHAGDYRDAFSGEAVSLSEEESLTLPPWGYRVLTR